MRKSDLPSGREDNLAAVRARRLKRYSPLFRARIAALTCCSSQAEDLADSFPGLLVALVSNVSSVEKRSKAFDTVLEGGSVKAAAEILGLPFWLKKMPPEAFREPIRHLPSESQFTAKITNFIPDKAHTTGDWLEHVSFADEACGSSFALWVAKHCSSVAPSRRKLVFLYMASWAWHCVHADSIGHRLIDKPWSPKMGLRRATEELMRWRRRVDLACLIGDGIQSTWLKGGRSGDYEFVPLLTIDDFISESEAMNNCLDQYSDRLATGLIRVFSIRQDNKRIADIEVGPTPAQGAAPSIVQIKAAHNRQAPIGVWQAAQIWLESQARPDLPRRPGLVRQPNDQIDPFWHSYLDWLPAVRRAEFEACLLSSRRRITRRHLPHPVVDDGHLARRTAANTA